MKHSIFRIFLILYFIPSTTYAMDLVPVYTRVETIIPAENNVLIDTIVSTIDGALTKKYMPQTNFFGTLSQENMIGVISMVGGSLKTITPTNDFISQVYAQNNLFKKSVDYFTALACKDLDNVSIDTLTIIEQKKCTPQLTVLPIAIAIYIMKSAYSTLKSQYDMAFSDHNEALLTYDICPPTDQAASTGQDKSLRIYSLKQGKQVFVKYEKDCITAVCFNNDGTQLATLVKPSLIKIWDPSNYNLLHTIDTLHPTYSLSYNEGITKNILSACTTCFIHQWDVMEQSLQPLGIIPVCGDPEESQNYLTKKPYTLTPHTFDRTSFTIRKTGCDAFCLLKKAVANTQQLDSLNTIERLRTYQELTDYEKHMIQQDTQNKKISLRKSLPKTPTPHQSQTTQLLTNKY